jgi:DNA invertase Pin-like site-specific DNA recombinase
MELYVAYMRVSTQRQGKSGLGLAAQRKVIWDFVQNHGELLREFVEIESGKKEARGVLWEAIRTAKALKAKLLIARLDRFSRSVSFIARLMDEGIGLTVAEMPTATDFQLHIFAALAQEERRLISQRTKAALQQAKAQGRLLGANGKVLAARRRDEARIRSQQVREALGEGWQGLSYAEVARLLQAKGVECPKRGYWCSQLVKNMLVESDRRLL